MYAIVKTGGKQYKVAPGTVLAIEKLDAAAGEHGYTQCACGEQREQSLGFHRDILLKFSG